MHAIATKDPLTKVANRAELNSRLPEYFADYQESGRAGSLVICDIDFFKRINDTHGHQAGDEALVTFAGVLRDNARDDDLVARYGGEEFVVFCDGCDNSAATQRAEAMRQAIERTPVPALGGDTMSASFGVTEIQPGDSEDTLMARADRALMIAKEKGRNRVVQLGAGGSDLDVADDMESNEPTSANAVRRSSWLSFLRGNQEPIVSREYLAAVPREIVIEKLSGFIADHFAEIVKSDEKRISLRIDGSNRSNELRAGERPTVLLLDVDLLPVKICSPGRQKTYQSRTKLLVVVRAIRARDRRTDSLNGQALRILKSFQAYLVAQEIDDELKSKIIEPR